MDQENTLIKSRSTLIIIMKTVIIAVFFPSTDCCRFDEGNIEGEFIAVSVESKMSGLSAMGSI